MDFSDFGIWCLCYMDGAARPDGRSWSDDLDGGLFLRHGENRERVSGWIGDDLKG